PIANRTRSETESLIGFFVNMLVMRSDINGGDTYNELLARVKATALAAYAHQDLPFERLVQELQPERNPHQTPLFQVVFSLQNAAAAESSLEGLTLTPFELETKTTHFDLSLEMTESVHGLEAAFEYRSDVFSHDAIGRMLEHFDVMLQ